jgi:hypothetical protein
LARQEASWVTGNAATSGGAAGDAFGTAMLSISARRSDRTPANEVVLVDGRAQLVDQVPSVPLHPVHRPRHLAHPTGTSSDR